MNYETGKEEGFYAAGSGEEIRHYDLKEIGPVNTLRTDLAWVTNIELVCPNIVVYTSIDNIIYSLDIKKERDGIRYLGHIEPINIIRRIPNNYFLSASRDRTVKIYKVNKENQLVTYRGHQHEVTDCSFIHSKNWIASSSQFERVVKVWDPKNIRKTVMEIPLLDNPACMSYDAIKSAILVSCKNTRTVRFFDFREKPDSKVNGNWRDRSVMIKNPKEWINTMAYFQDECLLVTGDMAGEINYFDIRKHAFPISKKKIRRNNGMGNISRPVQKYENLRRFSKSEGKIKDMCVISDESFACCNEDGIQVYSINGEIQRMISTKCPVFTICPKSEIIYDKMLGLLVLDENSSDDSLDYFDSFRNKKSSSSSDTDWENMDDGTKVVYLYDRCCSLSRKFKNMKLRKMDSLEKKSFRDICFDIIWFKGLGKVDTIIAFFLCATTCFLYHLLVV